MLGQEKCPLIIAIFAIIVGEGEADDIIVGQTVDSPGQPGRPPGAGHTAGGLQVLPQLYRLSGPQLGWSSDTGPADPSHLTS